MKTNHVSLICGKGMSAGCISRLGLVVVFLLTGIPAGAADDDPSEKMEKYLTPIVAKIAQGQKLGAGERDECNRVFVAYCDELRRKNNATDIYGYSDEDNAAHYVNSVLMAIIDPARHGRWPDGHGRVKSAYNVIRARLEKSESPALMTAVIIPAILNREAAYACDVYEKLAGKDPFLADYIRSYVQNYYFYEDVGRKDFLARVNGRKSEAPAQPTR